MCEKIRVAIIGVGNCASSLYQGLFFYKDKDENVGIIRSDIGGYTIKDIEVVAAFDVDSRKVGKHMKYAILETPNCTPQYVKTEDMDLGPKVLRGNTLDGISDIFLSRKSENETIKLDDSEPVSIEEVLKSTKTDVLINYLPVGSQLATEYYANCCLNTGVSLLNCIPVFIASDPIWDKKFETAGIPMIGDDMKSQFGASILSQLLQELALTRGLNIKCHIQRNIGGNMDFLNMTDQSRLKSKKKSKENVITSQNKLKNVENTFCHAGPSEYISYHKDNKIANLHMEMEGFMGAPITLDAQLSVIDSPNSAGVVLDAIRYLKVAREIGLKGSLKGPSAFTQKSPPVDLTYEDSIKECEKLSNRL